MIDVVVPVSLAVDVDEFELELEALLLPAAVELKESAPLAPPVEFQLVKLATALVFDVTFTVEFTASVVVLKSTGAPGKTSRTRAFELASVAELSVAHV